MARAVVLGALVAVALVLRTLALGSDLWIDEAGAVVEYARYSWPDLLRSYDMANNHLLNNILIKLSVALFGEAEWSVRLPAVLFGVAGVWAQARLGEEVASRREAWGAALLLAVSYHHIFFSQNARGYTALVFWSTVATIALIRLKERPTPRYALGYVASILLAMLSHAVAVVVLVGHALAFAGFRHPGSSEARRPAALGLGALGAGSVLALVLNGRVILNVLSYFASASLGVGSDANAVNRQHRMAYFATEGREALGYQGLAPLLAALVAGLPRAPLFWLGLGAASAVGILGLWRYWRQSPFLGALWTAPLLVMGVLVVTLRMGVYPRFFLFLLPALLLVVVRGIEAMSRLWRARSGARVWERAPAVALVAGVLVSLASLPEYYRHPKQDFRGALAYVQSHRGPGEPVATAGLAAVGYRYYAPHLPVVQEPAQVDRLCGSCRAVWLIYTFPDDLRARAPALYAELGRRLQVVRTFPGTVGGGAMVVAKMATGGSD